MLYQLLDHKVIFIAYKEYTVEELIINMQQQKKSNKIVFKSCQNYTLGNINIRIEQRNIRKTIMLFLLDKKNRFYDKVYYIIIENN